jgi:hypothetical protein
LTHDVSAALAAVGVLGIFFPQTRVFSLAALAALTLRFPTVGLVILLGCVAAFYFLHIRK